MYVGVVTFSPQVSMISSVLKAAFPDVASQVRQAGRRSGGTGLDGEGAQTGEDCCSWVRLSWNASFGTTAVSDAAAAEWVIVWIENKLKRSLVKHGCGTIVMLVSRRICKCTRAESPGCLQLVC